MARRTIRKRIVRRLESRDTYPSTRPNRYVGQYNNARSSATVSRNLLRKVELFDVITSSPESILLLTATYREQKEEHLTARGERNPLLTAQGEPEKANISPTRKCSSTRSKMVTTDDKLCLHNKI